LAGPARQATQAALVAGVALAVLAAAAAHAGGSSSAVAPAYVPDAQCTPCHAGLVQSFPSIGMARSFGVPSRVGAPEDFSLARFAHAASGDRYALEWRPDGRLWFSRWREPQEGGAAAERFDVPVDFFLGSGNRARTYLYRTPSGELFQLPLAWYSQERRFAMAPGFDRTDHEGISRRVRRECLFCHDATPVPEPGENWDARSAPHRFPGDLPHGIGCQRCHGPGSEHARLAWSGVASPEALRAAIVQPARLATERARDVCAQCHLQPSVALPGLRRLGTGDFSFRPGARLSDHVLAIEAVNADRDGTPQVDRIEINHHAHRLERSSCFAASDESAAGRGRLACFSCHDPHRKPERREVLARVRAVCLSCHQAQGDADDTHRTATECSSCHMPERRPRDVVRVTITDHRIAARPAAASERLAPLAEEEPVLLDLRLAEPTRAGADADLYRTLAVVRGQGAASPEAVERLRRLAVARAGRSPDLLLDAVQGLLNARRHADAEELLRAVPPAGSVAAAGWSEWDRRQAEEWRGLALAGQGRYAEAVTVLAPLRDVTPPRPEALYNLGLALRGGGRAAEAAAVLSRVVELRPQQAMAWYQLGLARRAAGLPGALEAFDAALRADPDLARARQARGSEAVAPVPPDRLAPLTPLAPPAPSDTPPR
jgi:predicted CXXCH cytochrome family protein